MLGQLQRIGKALMLPIAVLPAAGLLLRLGQPDTLNIPFMANAGNAVFANLAILFAIGVAVGFAKDNHGLAGLAGYISYEILTFGATAINKSINLGALGGILAGLLAGWLVNLAGRRTGRAWLENIGGPRALGVIWAALASVFLAIVFGYVWPYVQDAIDALGHWLGATGAIGAGLYGLLNRLLIPFGLHHVINTYIWFVFGSYHGVTGDLNRFFAGDPTAGGYMAGFFPIMMFGLPGAALAMIVTARPERRRAVMGVLGSAAFTSFLTGITEPIEFAFMFLAPALYVVHAILTGLSLFVCYALGIRDGFSFSAGLIDYVLNRNHATHGWWLLPIGIIVGVLYFVIFYAAIRMFDLKTPGREEGEGATAGAGFIYDEHQLGTPGVAGVTSALSGDGAAGQPGRQDGALHAQASAHASNRAKAYVDALGGFDNIQELEACVTRLRLQVRDAGKLDEGMLRQLGTSGVIRIDNHHVQVVVGTVADMLADEIREVLSTRGGSEG